MENETFAIGIDDKGMVRELFLRDDPERMNWVIDPNYLQEMEYPDEDKGFGGFTLAANGRAYTPHSAQPIVTGSDQWLSATYKFESLQVKLHYSMAEPSSLRWTVSLTNLEQSPVTIEQFHVWLSLAYVMFRDEDVHRNMTQSCAVFPSISPDFSRFAAVRRSNRGPHLGIYNTEGRTLSLGSFCRFENRFLDQVSPSLDGLLFHMLVLAGSDEQQKSSPLTDWMYPDQSPLTVAAGETVSWTYVCMPYDREEEFYENGLELGFPKFDYTPVLTQGGQFTATARLSESDGDCRWTFTYVSQGKLITEDVTAYTTKAPDGSIRLNRIIDEPGEYKLSLRLPDGREDMVIFSVLEPIREIIEARVSYLCEHAYNDKETAEHRYAFEPVSNQGESLGKLSMILMKNLIGARQADEIRKVEQSAVHYVKPRWFADGDFQRPRKLYGSFYRIFDFDYIAHVFYLLARFHPSELQLHAPQTYLRWAGELMIVRFDEQLHADDRERRETGLTGVFTLFLQELLQDLRESEDAECRRILTTLTELVDRFLSKLVKGSERYAGAITEHYYDNAGFGPSCEALCLMGETATAGKYGELLLANVGFSNDYRAQNPDRWWEALAYMIHSLWGGLVAGTCLTAYEHLKQTPYLKAAYRSMMPVFSGYDWNIHSTDKRLRKGEAASTYCVASPNMNKPSLSRNRFGQSVFQEDFDLLAGNATGDDWDMGEEIAAYLKGFGTKTFLYYENGEIRCVNGYIRELDGQMVVTSYAAYPKAYYFLDNNDALVAEGEETIPQIVLDSNHRLKRWDH